jgi:hypothetical protein
VKERRKNKETGEREAEIEKGMLERRKQKNTVNKKRKKGRTKERERILQGLILRISR